MDYIDLSKSEDQGKMFHDVVDKLDKPGKYRIIFGYENGNPISRVANVVWSFISYTNTEFGDHYIIVESNGKYQSFYYNGAAAMWKIMDFLGHKLFNYILSYESTDDEDDCSPEFISELRESLGDFKDKVAENICNDLNLDYLSDLLEKELEYEELLRDAI